MIQRWDGRREQDLSDQIDKGRKQILSDPLFSAENTPTNARKEAAKAIRAAQAIPSRRLYFNFDFDTLFFIFVCCQTAS